MLTRKVLPHPTMSGRGKNVGRGGRGYTRCKRGQGHNYSGANSASKKGLFTDLGKNIFNCGHKEAADQMITSWEKLVQYTSTNYRQDISNDPNNKIKVEIVTPLQSNQVLVRNSTQKALACTGQSNIQ